MLTPANHDASSPVSPSGESLRAAFAEAAHRGREATAILAPADLAAARDHLEHGWPGVAAAALLAPAWSLPEAPPLADVPDAHWGDYMDWLLAIPANPPPEFVSALARHLARRTAELADWMERNLAAPPVRAAADAYFRTACPPLALLPTELLLPLQQARARILQRSHGRPTPAPRPALARTSRPLRVGILHTLFDHRPETFATLARSAQLDPRRVELHFIALAEANTALEDRCRSLAHAFHLLPDTFSEQFSALTQLSLDCLVLGDNLALHPFPGAYFAQLRAAPLQIVLGPLPTGLSQIDLLLTGELDDNASRPRAFSERLGLLPGTALAWDTSPDRPAEATGWTRESLGLEAAQRLVVCPAPADLPPASYERLRPLLNNPANVVLFVPEPGRLDFDALRTRIYALGEPNLRIHEPAPLDHAEYASILGSADLALDLAGPAATLALEAGVPVLAPASSPTAALLRTASLADRIFPDENLLIQGAACLLADPEALAAAREQTAEAMDKLPRFADAYALSADFSSLLEKAWDQLVASGSGAFRRQREPLRLATPHSLHPGDLHAEALALLSDGRPERAVPCLLSAIQRAGADAALWFDLARAYHAAGQAGQAAETLEASLRLDADNAAGWRLLCLLASEAGNTDLAREALDLASGLAPDHPDLPSLRSRASA